MLHRSYNSFYKFHRERIFTIKKRTEKVNKQFFKVILNRYNQSIFEELLGKAIFSLNKNVLEKAISSYLYELKEFLDKKSRFTNCKMTWRKRKFWNTYSKWIKLLFLIILKKWNWFEIRGVTNWNLEKKKKILNPSMNFLSKQTSDWYSKTVQRSIFNRKHFNSKNINL